MSQLNKYGELEGDGGGNTAVVECRHCEGTGHCRVMSGGGVRYSCHECEKASGVRALYPCVKCSVCGGAGQVLLKAK
jgi:hypothetical protein